MGKLGVAEAVAPNLIVNAGLFAHKPLGCDADFKMIGSIHFKNFRVLRDTTLPLSPFTLIVGPNGSGKSTVFVALEWFDSYDQYPASVYRHVDAGLQEAVEVDVVGAKEHDGVSFLFKLGVGGSHKSWQPSDYPDEAASLDKDLRKWRRYSFDPGILAKPAQLSPHVALGPRGEGLAVALDQLRDDSPERFEALNNEIGRWLPEFDRVLFTTPGEGHRALSLRTRRGGYNIPSANLSQGTLIALAILTLAYLPDPPAIVGLEEPDRGLHPRLLREVRDAIYRLTNPAAFGEKREPVQVIATTHSPFFLDLFRDHPEEIVIAEKVGLEARFQRLSDRADLDEILGDASLGEVWYSGVLGGVPAAT